jgi:hypothetical protein
MTIAARRGDIGDNGALAEVDRQHSAITPTIIATLLAHLKCANRSPPLSPQFLAVPSTVSSASKMNLNN